MKKLWQTEWFEIEFNTFIKTDPIHIANEKFYEKFYEKYQSYDDLPEDYKKSKISIAKDLLLFSENYNTVLSIGCGNGIIENHIAHNSDKTILAIEPSNNSHWIQNIKNITSCSGYFPQCIENEEKYQFGYCSTLDYVFNDQEYNKFLQDIYNYKFEVFYFTGIFTPDEKNLKDKIKSSIRMILSKIGFYKQKEKGQFWGYLRSIDEHISFLKQIGFKNIEYGQHAHGNYWIKVYNA